MFRENRRNLWCHMIRQVCPQLSGKFSHFLLQSIVISEEHFLFVRNNVCCVLVSAHCRIASFLLPPFFVYMQERVRHCVGTSRHNTRSIPFLWATGGIRLINRWLLPLPTPSLSSAPSRPFPFTPHIFCFCLFSITHSQISKSGRHDGSWFLDLGSWDSRETTAFNTGQNLPP